MAQIRIQQAFDQALQHYRAGRLQEAESIYRQILAHHPTNPDAMHFLGVIAHQMGRSDVAVDLIRRSIALQPNVADKYSNLGNVLRAMGQHDEAISAYCQAMALKPDFVEAQVNLADALQFKGQLDASIAAYRQAISLNPNSPQAHCNLGSALRAKGQLDEAIGACRRAITLNPNLAEAYGNLGNALRDKGQFDQAIAAFGKAIALNPNLVEVHGNLGTALQENGQFEEAICEFRSAIALKPSHAETYVNLGHCLNIRGRFDEAIVACRQAIALDPNLCGAYVNLGNALKDTGQLDEAIAAYRHAIAKKPDHVEAHGNLVYAMHFHGASDARAIAEEHRRWNRQHAEPLREFIKVHTNDRRPDRVLRIGYVSPDFRAHCQSLFTVGLFSHHNHERFEIFCYSSVTRPDEITRNISGCADAWRTVIGVRDAELAEMIRGDGIDVLVDLTMHMSRGRPLLFARKPAPVQVAWLAYPGSTGMSAMDYRLTDPYLDPTGTDESVYSERTIRMPDAFWCYDPLVAGAIPVSSLPALGSGVVTFGCLNNFCKVNNDVLSLWAKVLSQLKNSRLLLLANVGDHRRRTLEQFRREGVEAGRIEFVAFQPRQKYLETYHRIDVGLDTFPYNGHTTSLDSFWMGVPVVTRVGKTAVSRAGWCQLSNLGLTELAAETSEDFVRIAVELASDLPRMQQLRSTLRRRMEQSPLMDAPKFARNIEAAYRQMWRNWCETASTGS